MELESMAAWRVLLFLHTVLLMYTFTDKNKYSYDRREILNYENAMNTIIV